MLILGSEYDQAVNDISVDEFRLSSVAREPSTLGFGQTPLKPDPFTMLLENFDNVQPTPQKAGFTATPLVIATAAAPKSYLITDGKIMPGKNGQAWMINRGE